MPIRTVVLVTLSGGLLWWAFVALGALVLEVAG